MNECQVWWTITGNFGSMMPIDWSKSTARAKHLPTLNLAKKGGGRPSASTGGGNSGGHDEDDDLVAADLDMHSLILNSNPCENAVSDFENVPKRIAISMDMLLPFPGASEIRRRSDQGNR